MLPKKNGFDVCRDLRQKNVETPILMLTAKGETIDKVLGLKLGADDYLTKPFEVMELLARIEALLRRVGNTHQNLNGSFKFRLVAIDFRRAEVLKDNQPVELSALEFKLLQYLIEHRGEVLKRDELLDEVWGYDAMPSTRTVDVHVAWLRQKLEENPKYPQFIQTVHGLGYKFTSIEKKDARLRLFSEKNHSSKFQIIKIHSQDHFVKFKSLAYFAPPKLSNLEVSRSFVCLRVSVKFRFYRPVDALPDLRSEY